MANKVIFLFLGITLVIFGCFRCINRVYHDFLYNYHYDFGPYHYLFGIFVIVIGIIFIYISLRKKSEDFEDKFLICPKCERVFNIMDFADHHCPNCQVKLEDLEGFYERHPEF